MAPAGQRSIASFFSPLPPSAKKKPALHIGVPDQGEGKRKNAAAEDESPSKRSRLEVNGLAEEMQVPAADDRSAAAAEARDGNVGRRLKVYWPEERRYFAGVIRTYDPSSRKSRVCYDDGDEEMIVLENEKFSWLDGDEEAASETVEDRRRRVPKRRRHGLLASLDEGSDGETKNGAEGLEVKDQETKVAVTEVQLKPSRRRRLKKVAEKADTVAQVPATSGDEEVFKDRSAGKVKYEAGTVKEEAGTVTDEAVKVKEEAVKVKEEAGKVKDEAGKMTYEVGKVKEEPGNEVFGSTSKDGALGSNNPVPEKIIERNLLKAFLTEDVAKEPEQLRAESDQFVELSGEALERFGGRDAAKFSFLGKYRKDASGRRPDYPNFDPRTLFLPAEFRKGLSEGQRQWWEFKSRHMDKVLLFKMGKFYEMFEMDAHIGVQDLDLQYMKGEQPHCGFPEKNYAENAARLARKGHRVLVIEQTETPEQLEARKRKTGAKDKVVRREICAVITKGTMVDAEMVGDNAETAYLLAVAEKHDCDGSTVIGLCAVDTSRALFIVGQVNDDAARTKLKSILAELRPVELVKPSGMLSEFTERALHAHSRSPLVNNLVPTEFWTAERTLKEISSIYIDSPTPEAIRKLVDLGADGEPALSAFGGCVSYLQQALLHQQLLKLGRVELLIGSDFVADFMESSKSLFSEPYMALDSAALENLEILENSTNAGVSGTLLGLVDHCTTPFGRRLLKKWIVRPLVRVESILERQCAIEDLQGDAATAVSGFRKEVAGIPDLERLMARLNARSGANGRDGQNVVLYEDAAKKRIKELLAAVRGCQTMMRAISCFGSCLDSLRSDYLRSLVTPGKRFPFLDSLVQYFENAFDWSEAEQSGHIQLNEGVDESGGTFSSGVPDVKGKFSEYLQQQRKWFKTDEISYVTVGKDTYLLEIPEELHSKVPSAYELRSSRKGYRRYWTPEIKELLHELSSSQDQMDSLSKGSLQMLTKRLCSESELLLSAIQAVSELDALMSLSSVGLHMEGRVCRPTFSSDAAPLFNARALRHPIMSWSSVAAGTPFVPNDVVLGGSGVPHFMLLTGPNMGGKSTLLRQVCLAIILAQVGAHVPAETLELTPVDRLFVRMGAKDHIMSGQSTFLVELLETATMLRCASKHSLVALDELGRGTATTDGQAIAHAVLHHLAHQTECRGMFSTHYHRLADDHSSDKAISLQHMACDVAAGADGLDAVTFLYKLTAGSCPKSYGANVARIAGMPESVVVKAAAQSRKLEEDELNSKRVRLVKDILKPGAETEAEAMISLWRRCH